MKHAMSFIFLVVVIVGSSVAARGESIFTVFTGVQDGVDLRGPAGPPPAPIPAESIVNTDHGPFTLGSGAFTATFGWDGRAFHMGAPSAYAFSDGGRNFWGVRGDGVGTRTGAIAFSEPTQSLTLLARGTPAGAVSPFLGPVGAAAGVLRAFSPTNILVAEIALDNDLPFAGVPADRSNMQLIELDELVSRIELVNTGADNSFAIISLLDATAVPEPSSLALIAVGAIALLAMRLGRRG